ncbi:hypothetical protein Y032_0211g2211 [Ancylostoma ceylanicum]|uniref:Uncharacterized protein n=1 Tax=Ancylostoma ceylanicum TaxID=53326 RepID=A0A016SL41_9BILA|nr:hypothetical protein Y032_0211g2211 [Ancylostoma ceylanicum]
MPRFSESRTWALPLHILLGFIGQLPPTRVENLNHVRCALVSDCEKLGLLEMATTSAHHDDEGKLVEARLTLNMKEPRRKTSEDTYVMEVVEVTHP